MEPGVGMRCLQSRNAPWSSAGSPAGGCSQLLQFTAAQVQPFPGAAAALPLPTAPCRQALALLSLREAAKRLCMFPSEAAALSQTTYHFRNPLCSSDMCYFPIRRNQVKLFPLFFVFLPPQKRQF